MSYFLAFAGFAALIILHEFGHFVAAKAVGMRVERFSLFFPPLIARFRRKGSETEYAIGAIPLGGYVKITGMNPEEEMPPEVAHRAYFRQKVWKRIVVISAGPVVNLVLAFVILWGLYGLTSSPLTQPVVDKLTAGSPAAEVLKPGDRIVSVDGQAGYSAGLRPRDAPERVAAQMDAIATHTCAGKPRVGCRAEDPVRLEVLRDGEQRSLEVTPRFTVPPLSADAPASTPEPEGRMLLGLTYARPSFSFGAVDAASYSAETMWMVTTLTIDTVGKLFYDEQARESISGPVGNYDATRRLFEFDTRRAIFLLALLSLSLGIFNLFPFLPLDGGHIFWAVAEKLRGRPISLRVMERAGVVGVMLVLVVFYIGLTNDIGRLTSGEGLGVR
ncbi:MAG: M50 family metallopeptidase [Solirubrobacteraceae bacterium]